MATKQTKRKRTQTAKKTQAGRSLRLHHRIVAVGLIASVLVLTFLAIHAQLTAFAGSGSPFTVGSGKCLDNANNKKANRNTIRLYTCNGSAAQKWTVNSDGTIRNSNGYCLDAHGDSAVEKDYAQLYKCNGGKDMTWTVSGSTIVSKPNGLCLTAKNGGTANGTTLWLKACNGGTAQKWTYGTKVSVQGGGTGSGGSTTGSGNGGADPVGVSGSWSRIFTDEFTGSSVDTSKWTISNNGSMNKVTTLASNVKVADGSAQITLSSASQGGMMMTNVVGGQGNKNGFLLPTSAYVESRIRLAGNSSNGCIYNWGAFWVFGPNSWPKDGEHDIVETTDCYAHINYHSGSGAHEFGIFGSGLANSWHTYGLYRGASTAQVYWDGKLMKSYDTDDTNVGQQIVLNVGAYGTKYTGSQSTIKFDYVRAWKKN